MLSFEFSDKNPRFPVAFASFTAMHTVLEIVMVCGERGTARQAAQSVYDMVRQLDGKFNRFDDRSLIASVNRNGKDAVIEDEDTYIALQLCDTFRKSTHGYFDITAMHGSGTAVRPGYMLDPVGRTVTLHEGRRLDLGGFAKGYALEKAKHIIDEAGIADALVNFGDSSVLAIGRHPYGDHWPVGVASAEGRVRTCALRNSCLSVSGLTRTEKPHIVDPVAGEMRAARERITVEGRSPLIAEVLSTALYAAPAEKRRDILAGFEGYRAFELDGSPGGKALHIS